MEVVAVRVGVGVGAGVGVGVKHIYNTTSHTI